jgi:thymidylate synthase (FAD)
VAPHTRRANTCGRSDLDGDPIEDATAIDTRYRETIATIMDAYRSMLEEGVAREMARMILPMSIYTEAIWTCSFQAVMNFLELRLEAHSQWEIREYAGAVRDLVAEKFPILMRCWQEVHHDTPSS